MLVEEYEPAWQPTGLLLLGGLALTWAFVKSATDLADPANSYSGIDWFGVSVPLAITSKDYRVSVIPERADDLEGAIRTVALILELDEEWVRRRTREAKQARRFLPYHLRQGLEWEQFAAINVRLPERAMGDFRAQIAANATGVRRLHGWDEYRVEFSRALRQVADDLADAQDGVPPEAPRT